MVHLLQSVSRTPTQSPTRFTWSQSFPSKLATLCPLPIHSFPIQSTATRSSTNTPLPLRSVKSKCDPTSEWALRMRLPILHRWVWFFYREKDWSLLLFPKNVYYHDSYSRKYEILLKDFSIETNVNFLIIPARWEETLDPGPFVESTSECEWKR